MARQVKQFRYYNDGSMDNFPAGMTARSLITGTIFKDVLPIFQLGIQTLPGIKFYLNGNTTHRPVIIGHTGIYELSLNNLTQISALQFDQSSLDFINNQESGALFIDIVYEDGVE